MDRFHHPEPPPSDLATPITDARAPQPSAEGARNTEVTLPPKPNMTVHDCVRMVQDGMGFKGYRMSGEGTSEEKRDEFHRLCSTLEVVLLATHPQYSTLLDVHTGLPDGFVSEKGVNQHLFCVLSLLTSGAAYSAISNPSLVESHDGRRALEKLFTHLAPVTRGELRSMLRGVQDFRIEARNPPVPQANQLVAMRMRHDLAAGVDSDEAEFIQDFRSSLSYEYNNTHYFLQYDKHANDLDELHRRANDEFELIAGRRDISDRNTYACAATSPPMQGWRQTGVRPGRGIGPYAHTGKPRGEPRGRVRIMVCYLCGKDGHSCTRCPQLPSARRALGVPKQRQPAPPPQPAAVIPPVVNDDYDDYDDHDDDDDYGDEDGAWPTEELAQAYIQGARAAAGTAAEGNQPEDEQYEQYEQDEQYAEDEDLMDASEGEGPPEDTNATVSPTSILAARKEAYDLGVQDARNAAAQGRQLEFIHDELYTEDEQYVDEDDPYDEDEDMLYYESENEEYLDTSTATAPPTRAATTAERAMAFAQGMRDNAEGDLDWVLDLDT